MDKYKKYIVPASAKPVNQLMSIIASLERENKQLKEKIQRILFLYQMK